MTTQRGMSGVRPPSKNHFATKMMKMAIMKGGKVSTDRLMRESFKRNMSKKLDESRMKALKGGRMNFALAGTRGGGAQLSKKAEQALEEIARKKAAKEERELRKMVFITPMHYPSHGRLDGKGNIYDIADNLVMKVDKKGKVKTMTGWTICKYKPNSMMNKMMITSAIEKHSPYFINQRKLEELRRYQQLQQMYGQGVHGGYVPNNYGHITNQYGQLVDHHGNPVDGLNVYGRHSDEYEAAHRTSGFNGGMTSWGVMSDNVHGGYSNNIHGTVGDNIWGRVSTDIWGGVGTGTGGLFGGSRGWKIFGSGSFGQKNYVAKFLSFLTGRNVSRLFGGSRNGGGRGRR